jgi:hypothetical protein
VSWMGAASARADVSGVNALTLYQLAKRIPSSVSPGLYDIPAV